MKHLKIGYLQQHNVADVKTNMQRLADGVRDLAKRGAELVVLQELHNSLYFCQIEDVDNFDLAESIPGPSTDFYGALARECNVVIVTSLFERRAPGLYHNTAVVMERDGSIAGKYRKMHIPTTLPTTRSSTLHLATSASVRFRPAWANSVCSYAGTSGTRRQPD